MMLLCFDIRWTRKTFITSLFDIQFPAGQLSASEKDTWSLKFWFHGVSVFANTSCWLLSPPQRALRSRSLLIHESLHTDFPSASRQSPAMFRELLIAREPAASPSPSPHSTKSLYYWASCRCFCTFQSAPAWNRLHRLFAEMRSPKCRASHTRRIMRKRGGVRTIYSFVYPICLTCCSLSLVTHQPAIHWFPDAFSTSMVAATEMDGDSRVDIQVSPSQMSR